ncbi:MAG: glycosyltransferase family 4 protein [Betaproteobacteria bacterium]|nr:glycosyltransferase family 4 protein [Betaproteobacteria bacterium]
MASSKTIKIAYDPQIWSFQTYGGVSRYFCEIADRIAKKPDTDVSIVAPFHVNAYLTMLPKGLVSGYRGPQWNIGNRPRRLLAVLAGNAMLYQSNPDVIHETYFFPYCIGSRNARRVVTIHDMIHEKFPEFFPSADRTARYKAMAAQRADHVICVSESTRRDAIEILGLPIDKTTVIHHGYTLMATNTESGGETESPPGESFLLYVGSRGGYKNFSCLLAAFAASPQLRNDFRLICFGGGAFQPNELQEIDALGLNSSQVAQVGGSDAALEKYYRSAAAFVYPSLYEGFGFPPLEAMSYDCPVICSNAGSIPEVVGDAGEYFGPGNPESLREAIESVVGSDSRRRFLIAKGRDRLACFSWDRCAADTLAVYLKLV